MPPEPTSSLSSTTTAVPPSSPHRPPSDLSLLQPPQLSPLIAAGKKPPLVESLTIKVADSLDGAVPGILHLPSPKPEKGKTNTPKKRNKTAAILLSGASGGIVGPSSMYLGLATKLASLDQDPGGGGIPTLRLDYRYPARNRYCVADVVAAMDYLETEHAVSRFVLVGWSFGGAPVFTVAGSDRRVVACATVASQTAETEGIGKLAPRPVLLLHGSGDRTLGSWCSERLYESYGGSRKGEREMRLFEDDDHALTRNAAEAEALLCRFVMKNAGVTEESMDEQQLIKEKLVPGKERIRLMEKGGDLDGPESVE
ncbi:MAG: hypothetical protein Q9219_003501 [cf. Caloplaca sp. 3 TL-2023]